MQKVKVRNTVIAFDFLKGEKDLIVFLHGVGADRTSWKFQLPFFHDQGYSVAAIDMRGSGDSDARDASGKLLPISLKEFAADTDALIRELGFEKARWIGNSMGGVIILQAIQDGLKSLDKIVLGNTFACHTDREAILPRAAAALKSKSLPDFAKERIPLVYKPDIDTQTLEEGIYAMARKDPEAYLASWQATWSPDFRSILKDIALPALVISGSIDTITPVALSDELAANIPGAKHVSIEGAGHIAHADEPQSYNREVSDFLMS